MMICKRVTYFTDLEMIEYYQKVPLSGVLLL